MEMITPMKMKEKKWKDHSCPVHTQRTAAYCLLPILCNTEDVCSVPKKQMLLMHDNTLTPFPLLRSVVPSDCEAAAYASRSPAAPPKQIGRPISFALQLPPHELHQHQHFDSFLSPLRPTKAHAPDHPAPANRLHKYAVL
ncbi:uncharacterized protein MONOS_14402 [Monocercomonoides exilis]|uniref:uncharacterized protein n=1 Tax=Monocercomonoides exilis TaxID=2049356 RepID=UPI00355ACBEE|nr:hypothetical protein MONOS_14402 [Monocercomonoides exilis]|eukprot:MONOS_14402.1-p1 / transcript=MONOS_14402.1 / gene=MONOS_14402 / organism=Monocercomonoides_exilis_PA203 / gene_product=unspecified product / transcript_product=unspecified product / location=Mono_scaffold00995:17648-18067(-) / protein_length=140 / sequence_SO=supercontig / SO=protein_coding / is_pseudo=false